MKESSVLIILNELLYEERKIEIYEKEFDHSEKSHTDVYLDFCKEYFPEMLGMIAPGMRGIDCGKLLARLGHLSYMRFHTYIQLFIPDPTSLSSLEKSWIKENYNFLNEMYSLDIYLWKREHGYVRLITYECYPEKIGVPNELKEIIPEKVKVEKIGSKS